MAVARVPYTRILPFKARMGRALPWHSSYETDFNRDFDATVELGDGSLVERQGSSCFLRERDRVFHAYSTYGRGLDGPGSTGSLLDPTALGRQEEKWGPCALTMSARTDTFRTGRVRSVRGM